MAGRGRRSRVEGRLRVASALDGGPGRYPPWPPGCSDGARGRKMETNRHARLNAAEPGRNREWYSDTEGRQQGCSTAENGCEPLRNRPRSATSKSCSCCTVDDKIHRAQHRPVLDDHPAAAGGKAQFGGQRFGV